MEEGRNITATFTSILQKIESVVLETALKTPDQKLQKVQNRTVGKKTIRHDIHRVWLLTGVWIEQLEK